MIIRSSLASSLFVVGILNLSFGLVNIKYHQYSSPNQTLRSNFSKSALRKAGVGFRELAGFLAKKIWDTNPPAFFSLPEETTKMLQFLPKFYS
jgi:hypothetical protein